MFTLSVGLAALASGAFGNERDAPSNLGKAAQMQPTVLTTSLHGWTIPPAMPPHVLEALLSWVDGRASDLHLIGVADRHLGRRVEWADCLARYRSRDQH